MVLTTYRVECSIDPYSQRFTGLSIEVLPLFSVMMGNSYRPRQYGHGNDDSFVWVIKSWIKHDRGSPWKLSSFGHKLMFACLSWLRCKSLDAAIRELLKLSGYFNHNEILELVKLTEDSMQLGATTPCLLKHLNKESCDEEHGAIRRLTQDTDMGKSALRLTTRIKNFIVLKPVAENLAMPSSYLRFQQVFKYLG